METHNTSVGYLLVTLLLLPFFITMQSLHFSGATTLAASSNTSSCFKSERNALLDLKHSLVDQKNRLSSWTGDDCCRWYGVGCSRRSGRVVKLNLRNPMDHYSYSTNADYIRHDSYRLRLRGDQLNSSFHYLKHLTHLDLSINDFSGIQIPAGLFGSLVNLRYLNLSNSYFAGKVPHNLGNLSRLRYLDISYNDYQLNIDSLGWVSRLHSLKHLDLSYVEVENAINLFPAINLLPSLLFLNLGNCQLNSNKISNINLTSLVHLDLSENWLEGPILSEMGNLTQLRYLNLGGNQFTGNIPSSFEKLAFLEKLNVKHNTLSGSIPSVIGQLVNLQELDLSGNGMSDIVSENYIGNLTNLIYLNLSSNSGLVTNFTPTWTPSFQLVYLDLSSTKVGPRFPVWIRNQKNLEGLSLSKASILDNISENHFYYNLTSLKVLDLSSNPGIVMNFSPTWTTPFQLTHLYLSSTKVGPRFPLWIRNQNNLEGLRLSNASIVDNISENHFYYNLTSLKVLDLSSNPGIVMNFSPTWTPPFQLTHLYLSFTIVGPRFPLWIRNQTNLNSLGLSNAAIADNIPLWFSSVSTNLFFLDLSDNKLKGKLIVIPSNLYMVDVSNNLLSGLLLANTSNIFTFVYASHNLLNDVFPTWLCNVKYILIIDLSHNQLSGRLPSCIGSLTSLSVLNLMNNSFLGSIPSSLGSLPYLQYLNLHDNKFGGHLPSSFQNLTRLHTLDVGNNVLDGVIPLWIGQKLSSLSVLILHSNCFNGSIPQELCQLSYLHTINFASNKISGSIPLCFSNLSSMVATDYSSYYQPLFLGSQYNFHYKEEILERIQQVELLYNSVGFISIDLSNNNITGAIPNELMELVELVKLNLSRNQLDGRIPDQIGNLRKLLSLDLSRNKLFGTIPQSLSNLYSLEYLNLSFNDLSGKIPTGYQLQTLNDPSAYMGNRQLCGAPLDPCPGEHNSSDHSHERDEDDDVNDKVWIYAGMGPGLLVGFLGFCGALHFSKRWRYAYFGFLENVFDTLAVAIAVNAARLRRKFQKQRLEG